MLTRVYSREWSAKASCGKDIPCYIDVFILGDLKKSAILWTATERPDSHRIIYLCLQWNILIIDYRDLFFFLPYKLFRHVICLNKLWTIFILNDRVKAIVCTVNKNSSYKILSLFNLVECMKPVTALLYLLPDDLSCISDLQIDTSVSTGKGQRSELNITYIIQTNCKKYSEPTFKLTMSNRVSLSWADT